MLSGSPPNGSATLPSSSLPSFRESAADPISTRCPRSRSRAYLKALTALQDVRGRLNDAATALRVANESRGASAAAATGAVRGWVAAQAAAIEPELAPAWRRFARAKPFWLG